MTVYADLTLPSLDMAEGVVRCPECGQEDGLVVSVDVEDSSETPAFMRCDRAHRWADRQITRGLAVEIYELIRDKHPELIHLSPMG